MTKPEYEILAQSLIGEAIDKIEYFEIKCDGYETDFNDDNHYDSLDYGVNLFMESGKVFGFIWGDEFFQYGVSILRNPLQSEVSECREIDVSTSSKWNRYIGKKIVKSKVDWGWVKESSFFKRNIYYPQNILLTFEEGYLAIISAFVIREDTHFGMADNITVFFTKECAVMYGALNA